MDFASFMQGAMLGGKNSGGNLKSITWTGNGTTSNSITFPQKPTLLLAIYGINSTRAGYVEFATVQYGAPYWNYTYSQAYVQGAIGRAALTYSEDELTMTMTHQAADGACNLSGETYTLYYI